MRAFLSLLASTLLASAALAQETAGADRELIAKAAANRSAPTAADKPATPAAARGGEDLGSAETKARTDVALADARLELVLARKAMRSDRFEEAARRALRAQSALRGLPKEVDASVWELQADGIVARAEKHGVNIAGLRVALGAGGDPDNSTTQAAGTVDHDPLDTASKAAVDVVRQYSGANTPDIDTTVSAETLRQRTQRRGVDDIGYRPGREAFDRDAIAERDQQRLAYEDSLSDATRSDELRRLVEADELRVAPARETSYPDDWKERVARRARYAGGEIARSPSWTGSDGREWYAAMYDIRELTYVPPDFAPAFSLDPVEDLRNTLDRDALRQRSQIFSGTAEDLAAGIPLLRFFGGVDDFAFRGPMYSREKAAQIAEQVKAFTTQVNESKVILVP
jgi:hypothetical protein